MTTSHDDSATDRRVAHSDDVIDLAWDVVPESTVY